MEYETKTRTKYKIKYLIERMKRLKDRLQPVGKSGWFEIYLYDKHNNKLSSEEFVCRNSVKKAIEWLRLSFNINNYKFIKMIIVDRKKR